MDMNTVWAIVIIVASIAFAVGARYLSKTLTEKKGIDLSQELLQVIKLFDLGIDFIKEFNLPQEEKIADIAQIVNDACYFAVDIMNTTDYDEMMDATMDYAVKLGEEFDVEITESRYNLIRELINLALREKIEDYIVD